MIWMPTWPGGAGCCCGRRCSRPPSRRRQDDPGARAAGPRLRVGRVRVEAVELVVLDDQRVGGRVAARAVDADLVLGVAADRLVRPDRPAVAVVELDVVRVARTDRPVADVAEAATLDSDVRAVEQEDPADRIREVAVVDVRARGVRDHERHTAAAEGEVLDLEPAAGLGSAPDVGKPRNGVVVGTGVMTGGGRVSGWPRSPRTRPRSRPGHRRGASRRSPPSRSGRSSGSPGGRRTSSRHRRSRSSSRGSPCPRPMTSPLAVWVRVPTFGVIQSLWTLVRVWALSVTLATAALNRSGSARSGPTGGSVLAVPFASVPVQPAARRLLTSATIAALKGGVADRERVRSRRRGRRGDGLRVDDDRVAGPDVVGRHERHRSV
jgi:hypothetical protein